MGLCKEIQRRFGVTIWARIGKVIQKMYLTLKIFNIVIVGFTFEKFYKDSLSRENSDLELKNS